MSQAIWPKCVDVILWSSSGSKKLFSFSRSNQSFWREQRCKKDEIGYSSISWRLRSSSCVCYSVSSRRRVLHLLYLVHLLPSEYRLWCSLAHSAFHNDNHEYADFPTFAYDLANLSPLSLQDHVSARTMDKNRRTSKCARRWRSRMARWGAISKRNNRQVEQSKMESHGQICQCSSSWAEKGKLILSGFRSESVSLHLHGIIKLNRNRIGTLFRFAFKSRFCLFN